MALYFDGSNDYTDLGFTITSANGSMMCHATLVSAPANGDCLITQNSSTHGWVGLGFQFESSSTLVSWVNGGGGGNKTTNSASLSTGTWYRIGMSWGSGGIKQFINGSQDGSHSYTGAPTANSQNMQAGCFYYSGGRVLFPEVRIAEIAIWDVELGTANWAMLNNFCPLMVRPESLVRYVPLFGRGTQNELISAASISVSEAAQAAHPRIFYPTRPMIIPAAAAAPPATGYHSKIRSSKLHSKKLMGRAS